jgi:hypothetical protein
VVTHKSHPAPWSLCGSFGLAPRGSIVAASASVKLSLLAATSSVPPPRAPPMVCRSMDGSANQVFFARRHVGSAVSVSQCILGCRHREGWLPGFSKGSASTQSFPLSKSSSGASVSQPSDEQAAHVMWRGRAGERERSGGCTSG